MASTVLNDPVATDVGRGVARIARRTVSRLRRTALAVVVAAAEGEACYQRLPMTGSPGPVSDAREAA
jgi:hypothetical protein